MGDRGLEIARHLRAGADRLASIVQRLPNDGAIGLCAKAAVKVDFQRKFSHRSVNLLPRIDAARTRRDAHRMRSNLVGGPGLS